MTHIRPWMLAAILTICGTMNSFAQQPEDLRGIPGDSVLIVIDGKMLPKSMNPQLLNHIPKRYTGEDEPKGLLQQSIAEGKLKNDLQPYFIERKQYIDSIRVLIDVAATAIYGSPGRYGAIEITTRPFLSVAMPSPKESEARRRRRCMGYCPTGRICREQPQQAELGRLP